MHDPHSYADPPQTALHHIEADLEFDFDRKVIRGRAKYVCDRTIDSLLYLDSKNLRIVEMGAENAHLTWSIDRRDPILGERLAITGFTGQREFWIRFETGPEAWHRDVPLARRETSASCYRCTPH